MTISKLSTTSVFLLLKSTTLISSPAVATAAAWIPVSRAQHQYYHYSRNSAQKQSSRHSFSSLSSNHHTATATATTTTTTAASTTTTEIPSEEEKNTVTLKPNIITDDITSDEALLSMVTTQPQSNTPNDDKKKKAKIVVIGAGWWSQGWHLPQLHRNENAEIVAIVQRSEHPSSQLAELKSRTELSKEYNCPWYQDISDVFNDPKLCPDEIDGVLVATPHSTHYDIGKTLLEEARKRGQKQQEEQNRMNNEDDTTIKPLNILMEKPMTADIEQAKKLHDLVTEYNQEFGEQKGTTTAGCFLINHSANYREKTRIARNIVESGQLGRLEHISAFFASPLMEIFDDPEMKGWNEPQGENMIGNGFAWGQIAHMLGYIFHVCPDLQPQKVFCQMSHSKKTGADIAHAATIICKDGSSNNNNKNEQKDDNDDDDDNDDGNVVIISLSGTALVPGGETEGVGKQARVQIYGQDGALLYAGNDSQYDSGHLELRRVATGGKIEKPAGDGFYFENTNQDGDGPESLKAFIDACQGRTDYYDGAGSLLGLKTVQIIHAMYRSNQSGMQEDVEYKQ